MGCINAATDDCVKVVQSIMSSPKSTLGDVFDYQIEQARKNVEALCVKKAKLEALNMLHMPYQQIRSLLEVYPF